MVLTRNEELGDMTSSRLGDAFAASSCLSDARGQHHRWNAMMAAPETTRRAPKGLIQSTDRFSIQIWKT